MAGGKVCSLSRPDGRLRNHPIRRYYIWADPDLGGRIAQTTICPRSPVSIPQFLLPAGQPGLRGGAGQPGCGAGSGPPQCR